MLTFFDLLRSYDLKPEDVRLVRHGNKEIKVQSLFNEDQAKFTAYTAWQPANKYGKSKYLAIFAPARGTTSLFLGLWSVDGVTANGQLKRQHLATLKRYKLPEGWSKSSDYYDLTLTKLMGDLSQRLVIEWGGSTLKWVQKKNKSVVEIKPKNSIGEFRSYNEVLLTYPEIQRLARDRDSNSVWVSALSSVNGVYLIRNRHSGKLYVGSAYGKGGILARWHNYSRSGHGGNVRLKELDPGVLEFSILEIAPSTMSSNELIAREQTWKSKLGTRKFGLNEN